VAPAFALLLSTEYDALDVRLRTVLARLGRVPAYYAAATRSIRAPSREHTRLAIEQNRGALEVFGPALEQQIAASQLSAAERELFAQRLAATRRAISDFISALEDLDAGLARNGGARSFRLGRDAYERQFAFDNPGSAGARALFDSAQRDRLRILEEMDRLTRELWPRYRAAEPLPADRFERIGHMVDVLSAQHEEPAAYLDYVRRLIPQLESWVTENRLLRLDPTKPLVVRPTPAYQRGVAIAGIEAPGPYDPDARTYFNVLPLETLSAAQAESFLREYNRWMTPIFIIHEAVPGHYVQLIHANRSPSLIKSIFGSGVTIEGWAVYAERMMLESGYGANAPEMWLMYWKWFLRSVTNTVLDYGVHVLDLSEQQATRMLMREAFQSAEEARGKWRRVQLTSVQLTSYYSGFQQLQALRERRRSQLGQRFELAQFHEEVLGFGSAPLSLIQELMSGAPQPDSAASSR
jgi:uncharacterized protein (DUF885 family)